MPCVNRCSKGSRKWTSPRSNRTFTTKRAYKRCRIACSTPPMYWSTGSHLSASAESNAFESSWADRKRRKYHDESTNVSSVSVSRRAEPPQRGHVVSRNVFEVVRGESPDGRNSMSEGSSTGKEDSGTGTMPSFAQ